MGAEDAVYEALDALRRGARGGFEQGGMEERALRDALRTLLAFFDARFGKRSHHDEVAQRALIKAHRYADRFEGSVPAQAAAWLTRIYRTQLIDLHRASLNDPLGKRRDGRDAFELMEQVADEASSAPPPGAEADLERMLERLLDDVDDWLEGAQKRAAVRAAWRRNAELALLSKVRQQSAEELAAAVGGANRDTLYKWVERGRDRVLLPAIGALRSRLDSEEHAGEDAAYARFLAQLEELLDGGRRADAGKPRPARRGRVRPGGYPTSVQYDESQTTEPAALAARDRAAAGPSRAGGADE
ncbi:MAG TPA: hypothetical protein RMH85_22270 [Polyangiaceae bacterium LLY-WYZ-15_(1-7)]|nr:hypothetical protein [Sandaracinus sp.]HJL03280.1 hypothetical protein [Polyangiaceae bacterium LLY-WYZ-15_(1-7)]MBJ70587.1 hypothetical protein [Sandaracinus sp.]HJL11216.1 hypothetical protein [Polyangiaceae bacterium LLY-WYZ-15_(1-7)]HJL25773.1 hypothetical protein [Polyangiaceae bacterium LLY-WYZ-15_(1-7)]